MLTTNLWIQTSLVNGSIGQVHSIVYDIISSPPNLPKYVVVKFDNYIGPPWDAQNPKTIPITTITRGSHTKIPLTMAWAITIHKSQGLTLNRETIDIERKERQGLTFTTISRVKDLNNLRIHQPFPFEKYYKMENNTYTTARKKEEAHI